MNVTINNIYATIERINKAAGIESPGLQVPGSYILNKKNIIK